MTRPTPPDPVSAAAGPGAAPVFPGPSFLDYFLIILGIALSLILAQFSGLQVEQPARDGVLARAFRAVLPQLLFLPMGVVLFWPVFFGVQRLVGRDAEMTLAEWLWGLAWIGNLFFAIWFFWHGTGNMPETLTAFEQQAVGIYRLFLLALGVIAVMLLLLGMVRRTATPWTDRFCLALLSWPILPLLLQWLWEIRFAA